MITGKALRARGMERRSDGEMERWGVVWKEGWRDESSMERRRDAGKEGGGDGGKHTKLGRRSFAPPP